MIIPTTPVGDGDVIVSDLVPVTVVIATDEYAVDTTVVPEIDIFMADGWEGKATSEPTVLIAPPIDLITLK